MKECILLCALNIVTHEIGAGNLRAVIGLYNDYSFYYTKDTPLTSEIFYDVRSETFGGKRAPW